MVLKQNKGVTYSNNSDETNAYKYKQRSNKNTNRYIMYVVIILYIIIHMGKRIYKYLGYFIPDFMQFSRPRIFF